jgi:energy-coupling factor transporter ATP-binding protein EcfA2
MHIPQLQRGRALIITGPQACGKSTLALQIARQHKGRAKEVDATYLDSKYGVENAVLAGATVLIFEGLPRTTIGRDNAKQLVTAHTLSYRPRGALDLRTAEPPLLIFTTDDTEAARHFAADGRRFDLLDMAAKTATH